MKKLFAVMGVILITGCSTLKNATPENSTLVIGKIIHSVDKYYTSSSEQKNYFGRTTTVRSDIILRSGGVKVTVENNLNHETVVIKTGKGDLLYSDQLAEGTYQIKTIDIFNGTVVVTPNNDSDMIFSVVNRKVNNLGVLDIEIVSSSANISFPPDGYNEVQSAFREKFSSSNWNQIEWINVQLPTAKNWSEIWDEMMNTAEKLLRDKEQENQPINPPKSDSPAAASLGSTPPQPARPAYIAISGTVNAIVEGGGRPDKVEIDIFTTEEPQGSPVIEIDLDNYGNSDSNEWSKIIPSFDAPVTLYFFIDAHDNGYSGGKISRRYTGISKTVYGTNVEKIDLGTANYIRLRGTANVTVDGSRVDVANISAYTDNDIADTVNPYKINESGDWSIIMEPFDAPLSVHFRITSQAFGSGDGIPSQSKETGISRLVHRSSIDGIDLGSTKYFKLKITLDIVGDMSTADRFWIQSYDERGNNFINTSTIRNSNVGDLGVNLCIEDPVTLRLYLFWGDGRYMMHKNINRTETIYADGPHSIDLGTININILWINGTVPPGVSSINALNSNKMQIGEFDPTTREGLCLPERDNKETWHLPVSSDAPRLLWFLVHFNDNSIYLTNSTFDITQPVHLDIDQMTRVDWD
jgi:hypothetical protein